MKTYNVGNFIINRVVSAHSFKILLIRETSSVVFGRILWEEKAKLVFVTPVWHAIIYIFVCTAQYNTTLPRPWYIDMLQQTDNVVNQTCMCIYMHVRKCISFLQYSSAIYCTKKQYSQLKRMEVEAWNNVMPYNV